MALQTSGQISLQNIHDEAGSTTDSTAEASINDADIRSLIDKADGAENAFSEYYGASAEVSLGDLNLTQVNGQDQLSKITVSNYISSGGTLRVPSTLWIWSDSRTTPAMTVDIPCTIINEGKIIGCGGQGGEYTYSGNNVNPALSGGTAINVTSSGVTITNSSGAYIAGGGGGGGRSYTDTDHHAGGGGGAGGGRGGVGYIGLGGAGGALNASGADSRHRQTNNIQYPGAGGGAGGGGGGQSTSNAGGGGGGRILPGVGGAGGYMSGGQMVYPFSSNGGSGGNAGQSGSGTNSGGGGGWGASGGSGQNGAYSGASGGAAIAGTSVTLTNNGTIYGST